MSTIGTECSEKARRSGVSDRTSSSRADQNDPGEEEIPMLSWIPNLNGAAFAMKEHFIAGQPVLRMERQNADHLVGMPGSDQFYRAAGSLGVDLYKV